MDFYDWLELVEIALDKKLTVTTTLLEYYYQRILDGCACLAKRAI